jgi:hypothetical protein
MAESLGWAPLIGEYSVTFRVRWDGPHRVLPLDAEPGTWACYSCGTHFFSDHGYAVCPDDEYRKGLPG